MRRDAGVHNLHRPDHRHFSGFAGTLLTSNETTTTYVLFRHAVYRNILGTLDVYYQAVSLAGALTGSLSETGFAAYQTDAGLRSDDFDGAGGFAAGNALPRDIIRSADPGDRITSVFLGGAGATTSHTLVIRTNALSYTSGGVFSYYLTDMGPAGEAATMRPDGEPVPEPSGLALLLIGVLGLGAAVARPSRASAISVSRAQTVLRTAGLPGVRPR